MLNRRTFLAGCAALGAAFPTESLAADAPLGHLDHSSWVVSDGAAGIAAFRKLGFMLTPKPKLQVGGALSTFALFPDFTYLEIVETHSAGDRRYLASGANPEEASGLVESCSSTATALARRGIHMSVGNGAGQLGRYVINRTKRSRGRLDCAWSRELVDGRNALAWAYKARMENAGHFRSRRFRIDRSARSISR
jgi:hypothetical protein